jgi:hypothetical protein
MQPTTAAPQNPADFSPSDLAQFLNDLAKDAHNGTQQRLRHAAGHFQQLATQPMVAPVTPAQKMEIQRLAAHPMLSKAEKTKVLLAYYRYDTEQAAEKIKHLQSVCAALDDMRDAV